MTAPTSMNQLIHTAVRRDLDRLVSALAEARESDRERAAGLQRAYANLHEELTRHHTGEDTYLWPWLATVGVDPDLLTTMESEHSAMSAALAETDKAMSRYGASGSATDAAAARESMLQTQEVVNRHFDHEEKELEPQLEPHMDSPGWKTVEKGLRKSSPTQAGTFFAWLTDGMTPEGHAFLKKTVPTPVVTILSKVLGRSYNREVAPVWRAGRAT
jgi:hypothetical protein